MFQENHPPCSPVSWEQRPLFPLACKTLGDCLWLLNSSLCSRPSFLWVWTLGIDFSWWIRYGCTERKWRVMRGYEDFQNCLLLNLYWMILLFSISYNITFDKNQSSRRSLYCNAIGDIKTCAWTPAHRSRYKSYQIKQNVKWINKPKFSVGIDITKEKSEINH